jgi:Spy/CpxP family protein refolding chaperone
MKQLPKQFEAALTGPTVDRALLEKTRAQLIANLDQGSKVLTNALADAADSLTPEQRAKLAAMFAPKPKAAPAPAPAAPPAKP